MKSRSKIVALRKGGLANTGTARNVTCPGCGRSTPDGSFCQYCGSSLRSCGSCGARISTDATFCAECGEPVTKERRETIAAGHTSWSWWLLPLLLSWIGGIIAWALTRYRDPNKATQMLWFGISLTIILVVVQIVLRFTQHVAT